MADTTTTLNPGTAGDVMGESAVAQVDRSNPSTGFVTVKQPRVVETDDDGRLLAAPMSEGTGQQILAMLSRINDKLATLSGTLS